MRKVLIFSILLVLGLVGSQTLPGMIPAGGALHTYEHIVELATVLCLAFIMIHVGLEFEIDKANPRKYVWDGVVASSAAILPWILCALYVAFVLVPSVHRWDADTWKGSLLTSLFAAPTSAGVLFSMLAAGGLAATWLFRKARVLAIFDDLVTVLLMIPLKMLLIGPKWQLGAVVLIMGAMLVLAWKYLHKVRIPTTWPWVLGYGGAIVAASKALDYITSFIDPKVPVHIEVLLPAFVLGCVLAHHTKDSGGDPELADPGVTGHPPARGSRAHAEAAASTAISAAFMVFVGLSMPHLGGAGAHDAAAAAATAEGINTIPPMPWTTIALHVAIITVLSNLGKMVPAFCYRREAPPKHRLALAVGMWPRGEVGAGVLVIAIGYGMGGPALTIAVISLALNLVLTGFFIAIIKRLIAEPSPPPRPA